MPNVAELIEQSEKLVSIFGYWPSFHDAEVLELHFDRGEVNEQTFDMPVLTAKVLLWDYGDSKIVNETLAVIQFDDVSEFQMAGFNHQNSIYGLKITSGQSEDARIFEVVFDSALGMEAKFHCASIRVLNAIPCPKDKRCPPWLNSDQFAKLGP
jgi:hypothetical protein